MLYITESKRKRGETKRKSQHKRFWSFFLTYFFSTVSLCYLSPFTSVAEKREIHAQKDGRWRGTRDGDEERIGVVEWRQGERVAFFLEAIWRRYVTQCKKIRTTILG